MPLRVSRKVCASWYPPSLCLQGAHRYWQRSEQEVCCLSGKFAVACGEQPADVRREELLDLKDARSQREADELRAVRQAQLAHDAGAVGVHGLRAEMQQRADFARAVPLRGELEDFALPHAEPVQGAFPFRTRLFLVLDQHSRRTRVEEDFVLRDAADRPRE